MISIFQIYYDKNSYKHMDPSFYPYSSQEYNQYFESLAMKKIYEMNPELKNGMEYIGVTSWKMNSKTHLKGSEIIDYINKDIESGISKDTYIYSPIQGFISKGDNNGIISQPTIFTVIGISPAFIGVPEIFNIRLFASITEADNPFPSPTISAEINPP